MTVGNILVPVDGSPHSQKAVEFAADLAARFGADLHIVHVHLTGPLPPDLRALSEKSSEPRAGDGFGAAAVAPDLQREVIEDVGQKLLERAKWTAVEAGVEKVHVQALDGPVTATLLQEAHRRKADMIVMGSRGLGDLQGLLVGSTSHKVQQLAECTVVTIK